MRAQRGTSLVEVIIFVVIVVDRRRLVVSRLYRCRAPVG